jgi:hypothetical protein
VHAKPSSPQSLLRAPSKGRDHVTQSRLPNSFDEGSAHMSRVQSVNTLALAHPCLLAGPTGAGPFYCPTEPINTMRCCHALDPGMPMMSSTAFDSRRSRRASDGPIRSDAGRRIPAIVRCIPARHLSPPYAAHTIRRYHDGKARNDAGPWRDQVAGSRHSIARAPRWPSGFRRAAQSGDWQRASWHDARLLLAAHSSTRCFRV